MNSVRNGPSHSLPFRKEIYNFITEYEAPLSESENILISFYLKSCIGATLKAVNYSQLSSMLFTLNDKISYLSVINIYGEVISQYSRDSNVNSPKEEESANQLHHIAVATSNLAFENIKFMLLEKPHMKIAIINVEEDSLIVGIDKNASWAEISEIFNLTRLISSPRSPVIE